MAIRAFRVNESERERRPGPRRGFPKNGGSRTVAICAVLVAFMLVSYYSSPRENSRDPAQPELVRTLPGSAGMINALAFDVTGERLAATYDSKSVRIWNVTTGEVEGGFDVGSATDVKFVGMGIIATTDDTGQTRYWALANGQPIEPPVEVSEHDELALSPDGRTAATVTSQGNIWLWNLPTGEPVPDPLIAYGPDGDSTGLVEFSGSGRYLVAVESTALKIWDIKSKREVSHTSWTPSAESEYSPSSVRISSDGRVLARAIGDGRTQLWDCRTGRPIGNPLPGELDSGFSSTGDHFATTDGYTVWFWSTAGRPTASISGNNINRILFSPTAGQIAISNGGSVSLWRFRPSEPEDLDTSTWGPPTAWSTSPLMTIPRRRDTSLELKVRAPEHAEVNSVMEYRIHIAWRGDISDIELIAHVIGEVVLTDTSWPAFRAVDERTWYWRASENLGYRTRVIPRRSAELVVRARPSADGYVALIVEGRSIPAF